MAVITGNTDYKTFLKQTSFSPKKRDSIKCAGRTDTVQVLHQMSAQL